MMKDLFAALSLIVILLLASCNNVTDTLIEAESFSNKGGWLVDPQFVEQMGSPYLLAHGLGEKVENASTVLICKKSAKYKVWVRTTNWVSGNWEAPGRFCITINDDTLPQIMGTRDGWGWQYAGEKNIRKGNCIIALHDLTGFEGRCDAVYLTTGDKVPPDNGPDLSAFRQGINTDNYKPGNIGEYDLVVIGGGIAGCAAAAAAAEKGLEVALIHDRPVLGGNASSEIRVHTEGITWYSGRILDKLNTVHWPNGSPEASSDDEKRHDFMNSLDNISIYLNLRAFSVETTNDSITMVKARHTSTGKLMGFKAPVYTDCTGDGWIGYWAGADYMYGREESGRYDESLEDYGELWSPLSPDSLVMGSSVLWITERVSGFVKFPEVPWAMEVAENYSATSGTWKWEYANNSLHQINDGEKIRDHMFRAIYGSFYNAKKDSVNYNLRLKWMSYLLGKRESRRLAGDYIFTFNDIRNHKEFDDAVVKGVRPVDVHYQQDLVDNTKPDFLSEALYYDVDYYFIPFRSLYSRNIKNLMMAGRCFSCSHVGLGGPRVMNTTGQMGVATGYAAYLCNKYGVNPRSIYENNITELQRMITGAD